MARMLNEEQTKLFRTKQREFHKMCDEILPDGWLYETTDDGLIFFNNDTEEAFETNLHGALLWIDTIAVSREQASLLGKTAGSLMTMFD